MLTAGGPASRGTEMGEVKRLETDWTPPGNAETVFELAGVPVDAPFVLAYKDPLTGEVFSHFSAKGDRFVLESLVVSLLSRCIMARL